MLFFTDRLLTMMMFLSYRHNELFHHMSQQINCCLSITFQVYQAFSFIAWTEAMIEPIILICFDRNMNLLARFLYCDRDHYTASQIAFLMAQSGHPQLDHQGHEEVTPSQNSTEGEHAFHRLDGHTLDTVIPGPTVPFCQCSDTPPCESTPLRSTIHHRPPSCIYETSATSTANELRALCNFVPSMPDENGFEMSPQAAEHELHHQQCLTDGSRQVGDIQC